MFNLLFDNTSMPILAQVLSFTEQRQRVLAHNVANFNTPGFRTTDLPVDEFTEALGEAIRRRDEVRPRRFAMTSTDNIQVGPDGRVTTSAVEARGLTNYYDRADRSMERLQNEMLKNAVWHEMAAKLYTQQSQMLKMAIRGRL